MIDSPYRQLVQDHINFSKLLRLLEKEIGLYREGAEREPDLGLIRDIVDYLSDYPHRFHHPLEELAIDYLEQHSLADREAIESIRTQHREIERNTHSLQTLFDKIGQDHPVDIEEVRRTLERYLTIQREHLTSEEDSVFPAFRDQIPEAQWRELLKRADTQADPLFGDSVHTDFAELGDRLAEG